MGVKLRELLTFANVVSVTALFVALGGGAYAAVTLKKNSVTSTHIKNGQVKRDDIAKNAVNSSKIANASLLADDFKAGQLPAGPKGETGPAGPQGQPGAKGEQGAASSEIVARPRSTGPVTPAATTFQEVPMTANSWQQAADEMNTAWLKAEITNNACDSTFGLAGESVNFRVKLNGAQLGVFGGTGSTSPVWGAFPIDLEPGAATPRTLTVEAFHGCDLSGSFTINSVAINVIGTR